MTETTESDPVAGFAALMAGASADAAPDRERAPYGYTRDEATGEMRPKKSPGRPRKSPSLEDLKARSGPADADDPVVGGDRPPVAPKGRDRRRRGRDTEPPPVPQRYRAEGAIAKGVNQLYRKTGKIVIALGAEPEGRALIEITRADDAEDVTVGDAWEALCRSNPRIRAFWLRMLAGGAWSQVFMAHAPVAAAFLTRDAIRRRIPLGRLMGAFLEDGDGPGESPAAGTPLEGLRPEDVEQMRAMAAAVAERVMARDPGVPSRGEP